MKNPIDQWAEFAGAAVRQLPRDLSPAEMQRYIRDQEALAQALRRGLVPPAGILEALIARSGIKDVNYNVTSVNLGVTEEPDNRPLALAHPNKLLTTKQVLGYIGKCQQQPESPEHLVRYAIEHPEAGLEYPIAALGRFWVRSGCGRSCLVLGGDEGRRGLSLGLAGGFRWGEDCRFLVSEVPRK